MRTTCTSYSRSLSFKTKTTSPSSEKDNNETINLSCEEVGSLFHQNLHKLAFSINAKIYQNTHLFFLGGGGISMSCQNIKLG